MIDKLDADTLRAHKGKSFVGINTAVVILNSKGQWFLAKRSENTRDEHGRWDGCSGGLKWGVTIEENMRREILEEFAVVSKSPLVSIGSREVFRKDQNGEQTHWISFASIIVLSKNEEVNAKINEPENFTDSGWFDLDELPTPLHSVIDEDYISRVKQAYEAQNS